MKKTSKKLVFLLVLTSAFSCNAMEAPAVPGLFGTLFQNIRDKYNDLQAGINTYKLMQQRKTLALTIGTLIQWTDNHPLATRVIISATAITLLYGVYSITRDIIRKIKRPNVKKNLNKPLVPTKIQKVGDATSTVESI